MRFGKSMRIMKTLCILFSWTWRIRKRVSRSILLAFLFIFLIISYFDTTKYEWIPRRAEYEIYHSYVVNSPSCMIPHFYPDSVVTRNFYHRPKPLDCQSGEKPPLIASNGTSFYLVEEAFPFYNITDAKQLRCCYRGFSRPKSNHPMVDDLFELQHECQNFSYAAKAEYEFIKVACAINIGIRPTKFQDIHAFVPLKKKINSAVSTDPELSVLIVGIDSMSRLNFERQMPRTLDTLKGMSAVQMLGFNKVGENTFENLIPLLTGLNVSELRTSCWNSTDAPFDNCRFIWDEFSQAAYLTSFADDDMSSYMFNLGKKGFLKQPTDYYARPFFLMGDSLFIRSKDKCYGPTLKAQKLFEYAHKFVTSMKRKYFAVFWETSISHNELNYPEDLDKVVSTFLRSVKQHLNNTMLVFMSDHGTRLGKFLEKYEGFLENRLPLLSFVLPKWFKERYKIAFENLNRNTHRLTTHFDLHETLKNLMDLSALEHTKNARALSLFRNIPEDRSCKDAGIHPHWCSCLPIKRSQPDIVLFTLYSRLLDEINGLVKDQRECVKLKLAEVKGIRVHVCPTTGKKIAYYVMIKTTPGKAMFASTYLQLDGSDEFVSSGVIERLNRYGSQSSCILNRALKSYCYCK